MKAARHLALVLTVLTLSGCSYISDFFSFTADIVTAPFSWFSSSASNAEVLLVEVPPGWRIESDQNGSGLRTLTYVPQALPPMGLEDRVTVDMFRSAPGSPWSGIENEMAKTRADCTAHTWRTAKGVTPNGFEQATGLFVCAQSRRDGYGSLRLIRFVQGDAGFYSIERRWQRPPFALNRPPIRGEDYQFWADYMEKVDVCRAVDKYGRCAK